MMIKHVIRKIAVLSILSISVSGFAALVVMDVSANSKVTIEGQGYMGGEPGDNTLPPETGGGSSGSYPSGPATRDNAPVILILLCTGSLMLLLITIGAKHITRRKKRLLT